MQIFTWRVYPHDSNGPISFGANIAVAVVVHAFANVSITVAFPVFCCDNFVSDYEKLFDCWTNNMNSIWNLKRCAETRLTILNPRS